MTQNEQLEVDMVSQDETRSMKAASGTNDSEDLPPTRFEDAEPELPETAAEENIAEKAQKLQAEVERLTSELAEMTQKADSHWQKLLHKEADLQNMQKRAATQVDNAKKFALEKFAAELLQVADSLDQGLTVVDQQQSSVESVLEGLSLTRKVLLDVMEKEGIELLNPEGEPFNPTFHEAISMQSTSDVAPNTVMAVVQKGYLLNGRLLRPARVVVSSASTTDENKPS